jgi:hypothetical protein
MMSQEDRRRLAAIERHMLADDPRFVRRFRSRMAVVDRADRTSGGLRVLLAAAAVLGLVLFVLGSLAGAADVVLPGLAALGIAGAGWWLRRRRQDRPGRGGRSER